MGSWGKVLIVVLLTSYTSVQADSVTGESNANQSVECSITECEQLRNRIETLELAVRGIVSAMASQTTGQLALVNKILGRNVALRAIVSLATIGSGVTNNETLRNDTSNIEQQEKNYSSQLKTALKCSLAHLLDINSSAELGFKTSDTIQASITTNNALEITWSSPSTECLKVSSGVWLRVFESGEKQLVPPSAEAYLSIPPRCWKKTKALYSIVLPGPSAGAAKENSCSLELKNDLIQCLVYTVEVIPNYQSLKGRPLLTEMIIPPANDNSTARRELLIRLIAESNSLALKWKDNSGCAPRLTAVNLKIFPDGKLEAAQVPLSFNIPRRCLQLESDQNVFSLKLSRDHACPVQFELDACRKYMLELTPEYQNKFARPPILWDTFTAKKELYYQNNTKNLKNTNNLNCSDSQFSCFHNCIPLSWVCDGDSDCAHGEDELHCTADGCDIGFRCGSICTPKSQVCDGKYDCLDGSDEMGENCEFKVGYSSFTCYELKSHSGRLYDDITKDQSLRWSKSVVLISAENEHTIWLSINSFRTHHGNFLKVYDGPYSNSPLLLSHSGSTNPPSVRSSSNQLYLEFPSYSYTNYGLQMFYTTMNNTGTRQPFVPGCGGYVFGEGDIYSQSSFASSTVNVTECVWFVDALESDRTIRMTRRVFNTKGTATTSTTPDDHLYVGPIMIVYDGWGLSGQVLYDERAIPPEGRKSTVYSISHKTSVQFLMPPDATGNGIVYWDVYSMKAPRYIKVEINRSSGTLKPTDFEENLRDDNTDYHWHLVTKPNLTIQLLFAYFKTQELNYVQVYDGPTVKSNILLDKSGEDEFPFLVTSSTNELLVRYVVTWGNITHHNYGFLAVYS